MKKINIWLILICTTLSSQSQNLIYNGSFTDRNTCTEYHAACAPVGWEITAQEIDSFRLIPGMDNQGGAAIIYQGNEPNRRSYLQTRLLCPLVPGKRYRFEAYVSEPVNGFCCIGVHFLESEILLPKRDLLYQQPKLFMNKRYVKGRPNVQGWNKLVREFRAGGNEQYLIIGNFEPDVTGFRIPPFPPFNGELWVHLDSVKLIALDTVICNEYQQVAQEIEQDQERHTPYFSFAKRQYYRDYVHFTTDRDSTLPLLLPLAQAMDEEPVKKVITSDVLFKTDQSTIDSKYRSTLKQMLAGIDFSKYQYIHIIGHTDNVGSKEYNKKLSQKRAAAVGKFITEAFDLRIGLVHISGKGETEPVATNDNAAGRRLNRRVELVLLPKE